MSLLELPPELIVLLLYDLSPVDIIHMQQTCRALNKVIDSSALSLWREILRKECHQSRLFWPSFADLSSGSEYKTAATRGARFRRAYDHAVSNQRPLPSTLKPFKLPAEAEGTEIQEVWLVPGARFLLLFQKNTIITMDLHHNFSSSQQLFADDSNFLQTVYTNVVDDHRLHVLVELWNDDGLPQDLDVNDGWEDPTTSTFQLLTLTFDGSKGFIMERSSRFSLLHEDANTPNAFAVSGTKTLLLIDGATVLWDHSSNEFAAWEIQSAPIDVFFNKDYIMYMAPDGVHGTSFPSTRPIPNAKGYVNVHSITTILESAFFVPRSHQSPLENAWGIIGPDICRPIDDDTDIVYDLQCSDADANEVMFRYRFSFKSSDPKSSHLEFLGDIRYTSCDDDLLNPQPDCYKWCDGRMGVLWTDQKEVEGSETDLLSTNHYISLSSPQKTTEGTSGKELTLVPIVTASPDRKAMFACESFCLGTGMGVMVWEDEDVLEEEDELVPYVELHDFL